MKSRHLLLLLLFALAGCSLGPQPPQVVGRIRAPIDFHAVRLYVPQCKPPHYEVVAKLDASKLGNFSSYEFNMRWIGELRRQAAGFGANGLLLTPISTAETWGPIRHGPAFKVLAIWEPPTEAPATTTSMWAKPCQQTAKRLRYRTFNDVPGNSNVGRVGGSEGSGGP